MTHELILTSVAQGLNPKDHGFCPVASDASITPRVVDHLTALSRFRHSVADLAQTPVAYSHVLLPGNIEHVLSRSAKTETDDQQQPNLLTHHIALEGLECVPEGPGWLLALPHFHLSEWNEPPLRFPRGRSIPTLTNPESLTRRQQIARQYHWLDPQKMALTGSIDTESEDYLAAVQSNDAQIFLAAPPTSPCPAWNELTGDPGWGGVLAETVFTGQPAVLIYKPGQNILPLIVEAMALLPPYSSWQTTFCTYYTGLPDTIPCQWKGVIAGSEFAKQLVKDTSILVLDFSVPMKESPAGKYVDFARYGQEHMLPLDAEESAATLAKADTKAYDNETSQESERSGSSLSTVSLKISDLTAPTIQLPKHTNPWGTFLRRSSRFQFYLLYGIMFALVLFLLFLVVNQLGDFSDGLKLPDEHQRDQLDNPPLPVEPKQEIPSQLDNEGEFIPENPEQDETAERKKFQQLVDAEREKQKEPLLLFLKNYAFPENLPLVFPQVQDDLINRPEEQTFGELQPLYPFAAALELRFVPLFELSSMQVETRLLADKLPDWVWQVEAIDKETKESTPMFHFQLTDTGLNMDWRREGLDNQHLYDTVLSSLGFLELSVADTPESAVNIPLFAPVETEPVKVSDLAALLESEPSESIVELPFADELWQRIFAEMDPQHTLRLEVRAEPEGDWVQVNSSPESEFSAEVRTSQQVGKQTESGETVFENVSIPFSAEVSLEKVVWRGDSFAEQLHIEEADIKSAIENVKKTIAQLQRRAFEGETNVQGEREQCESERRALSFRLQEIENLLEKLPEAYKELRQNDTLLFHYSIFLESATGERRLLVLTTPAIEAPGESI
ncbi:MAG: hypothetical protein LBI05_02375 [Planctomycetaceae bacterium]|jgi:hypothetical protein|nr:hypothetical protein [Planctomycetaceae bacterium]